MLKTNEQLQQQKYQGIRNNLIDCLDNKVQSNLKKLETVRAGASAKENERQKQRNVTELLLEMQSPTENIIF